MRSSNRLPVAAAKYRDSEPMVPAHDPYEFSDESSASNLFKVTYRPNRSEDGKMLPGGKDGDNDGSGMRSDSPVENSGGGFSLGLREQELIPKMEDLNNLFDTSDSESNGVGIGGNMSDSESRADPVRHKGR